MDTVHRISMFEKASLGSATAAFAIALSLSVKDGPLDDALKWAFGLSIAAMPILVSLYVAKDAIVQWRNEGSVAAEMKLGRVGWAVLVSLSLLAGAIACLVWHVGGWNAGDASYLWFQLAVLIGSKLDMSLGRGHGR